jgi:PiT family inorganic phosphate transporter
MDAAFVLAVVATLAFAVTNGFHDAANAIATLVATRGARPGAALALAAVFNVLGPLLLGAAVANTIATIIDVTAAQTVPVVGAALTAGVAWNVVTWWRGLPSSSSHAWWEGSWEPGWRRRAPGRSTGAALAAGVRWV